MKLSQEGRDLIAGFEGVSLTAYRCPAGVWTIGIGSTFPPVNPGDRITTEQMWARFEADVAKTEVTVERLAAPCSQHEFDAMVSLAFNIGLAGFEKSTVLRLHKAGDKIGAARAFEMWCKALVGGELQTLPGLLARRQKEAAYYLTADAPAVKSMPQAVAPPPPVTSSKTVVAGATSVAAGAASVASQADQISGTIDKITQVGLSMQSLMKVGALGLSIIAVGAAVYILIRYLHKRANGQVVSQ